MNVVLIGFSGSGKSTVGQLLAEKLGWQFFDTDVEVERAAGKRIHEIFAEEGEVAFRRLESEAVGRALRGERRVVAVGGGAVVDPANRSAVREGNLVVLLEAAVDTLHRRLAEDVGDEPRPMLATPDPLTRIQALKTVRDPIYRETADLTIDTDGRDIEAIASQVAAAIMRVAGDGAIEPTREP